MLELNLPPCGVKIKKTENGFVVFDALRAKYVALTPEEWVRQNFVQFLVRHKGYPAALIANEMQIKLANRTKRCDTVVYNKQLAPLMIVEYKAPHVAITQEVFEQISRYNYVLRVPYLVVSNGLSHFCCRICYDDMTCEYLEEIPDYESIVGG